MSLVQPLALGVPAFDANSEAVFSFSVKGGNQVIANRLVIKNNDTNEEVYNKKIESYKFEHTVPAGTLKNGIYYNFYFFTYDISDNESKSSNVITFRCFDTPVIKITNIPENGIIDSSNFNLNISYSQEQGELIDFAKVILYDQLQNVIFQSENIYNTNNPPFEFQYSLNGLNDNNTYYVSVIVNTINRTVVESEKYVFTTRYYTPSLSSLLELENKCSEGYVQIKNNFYIVGSESNPLNIGANPNYLKNGKLYLTENGTYINWNEGFSITGNFTLKIILENPKEGVFCTLSDSDGNKVIDLSFVSDTNYYIKEYCVELKCYDKNKQDGYCIYSNYISNVSGSLNSKFFIWVRRINNIFDIKLEKMS